MIRTKRKGLLAALAVLAALCATLFVGTQVARAADSVTTELKATKTLNGDGADLQADQFEFTIEAKTEGAPMPENTTAKNDAEGNISFGNATYTTEGTYTYTVKEVKGNDSTITYDEEAKEITVTVKKTSQSTASAYPNSEAGKSKVEQQLVELSVGDSDTETNVTVDYIHGNMLGAVGEYTSYKTVTGPEGSYHPFCGAYYAAAEDDATESWNKRNRYAFRASNGSGGTWADAVLQFYQYNADVTDFIKSRISTQADDHAPDRSKYPTGIEAIFLNGYPHNAANLQGTMTKEEFYQLTQSVIFTFSRYAGDYKTADTVPDVIGGGRDINQDVFDKLYNGAAGNTWDYGLVDPVIDNGDGTYDSKIDIYVHWLNEGTAGFPQPLLSSYLKGDIEEKLTAEATTVEFVNRKTSEETGNLVVTKTFTGSLTDADKNKLSITIEGKDIDGEGKGTKTITYADFTNGEYKVEDLPVGEEYTVKETNADGLSTDYTLVTASSTIEGTATITANADATVALTNTYEPKDSSDSTPEPSIKTKVNPSTIEAAVGQTFTDTVTYENLKVGTNYVLEGKLMDKSTGEELSTSKAAWTYQLSNSGFTPTSANGTHDVVFNINAENLKVGDELVVYEYLHELDADGKTVATVATHEEINDPAQLVTIKAPEDETPAPTTSEPSIKTKVNPNTINASANQKVVDTVTYTNLVAGVEYTLTGTVVDEDGNKVADADEVVKFTPTEANAASGTQQVSFTVDGTKYAGKKLVVFEVLTWTEGDGDAAEEKTVKHEDLTDADQTITVKEPTLTTGDEEPKDDEPKGDDEPKDDEPVQPTPTPTPEKNPRLNTTVKVDGTAAENGKVLVVDGAKYQAIKLVDTIDYADLNGGETYTVSGEVTKFPGGTKVKTATETKVADASGKGTWELDFGVVPIDPNSYYVVFEYAYDADGNLVAEHAEENDIAQAVLVTEVSEDWPIIIENPGVVNTPVSGLTMATTVSINDKAASSTQARTVSYADVSKVKNVKDTITYGGFEAGATYIIKGELIDVATGKAIATAEKQVEASGTGAGTWTVDFTGVSLEAGKKYVVFEYAYDTDGNLVAEHADLNDLAQTIVVTAKPATTTPSPAAGATSGAKTTARTADDMGGVTLAMFALAVMAASGVAVARRKGNE